MAQQVPNKPDQTTTDPDAPTSGCQPLPVPPDPPPELPERPECTWHCECPKDPGSDPPTCLADEISKQSAIVAAAERAKVYVDELTAIQGKMTSALVDYTDTRYADLKKRWGEQHTAITELIRKVVCAVHCWECLLECRVCKQLVKIRALEDTLNGSSDQVDGLGLPEKVDSLYDLQFWHERSVAKIQARMDRIQKVLAAWEKPSDTLGDALDKNAKLIEDIAKIIATDPAKAVYDLFMTLIQRHWAIRPRDVAVGKDYESFATQYVTICECHKAEAPPTTSRTSNQNQNQNQNQDQASCPAPTPTEDCKCEEGLPDDCCGPDVGVLSLRQRLIGPLPYIVAPQLFPGIICCLTTNRLTPASDLLAAAQAQLAVTKTRVEQTIKEIADKTAAIATAFAAGLPTPFDCAPYCDDKKPETQPEPKQNEPQAQAR
jgi:hypothetical protein